VALPRFFIDAEQAAQQDAGKDLQAGSIFSFAAGSEVYHHAVKTLRLDAGKHVEIVLRDLWTTWLCEIEETKSDELVLKIVEEIPSPTYNFQIDLVLGFSKGDTNEKVVRQATELGVGRIIPVLFDRSISRPDKKRAMAKVERLRKIAVAAAQQSHRSDLPLVEELQSFDAALKFVSDEQPDLIFAAWEEESQRSLSEVIVETAMSGNAISHAVIVIGPEGGITAEEIKKLCDIGAHKVSLGATILRVDTAAVAAIALASDALRAISSFASGGKS